MRRRSCGAEGRRESSGDPIKADVRLKGTSISDTLLLLSPAMHWGVLINTNGGYGREEGMQTLISEDFAYLKLCDSYTYAPRGSGAIVHTPEVIHST